MKKIRPVPLFLWTQQYSIQGKRPFKKSKPIPFLKHSITLHPNPINKNLKNTKPKQIKDFSFEGGKESLSVCLLFFLLFRYFNSAVRLRRLKNHEEGLLC